MASEEEMVKTLLTWNTGYSADSVEWCPIEKYHNIFVCGTYQLLKEEEGNSQDSGDRATFSQKRLGKIYLFNVNQNTTTLEPIQTIETSAVLDQKWCLFTIDDAPYLAVANATGFVQIYKLSIKDNQFKLEFVTEYGISQGPQVLALSLDWSTNRQSVESPRIVISDSAGNITVCQLQNGNLIKTSYWNAHDYEAWICAFDSWDPFTVYTGGDDCTLKVYDLRCVENAKITNRTHNAGVTSLHFNIHQEHFFVSGSYDENLRLWDTRKMKRPIAEEVLGGGIWRLKWDPVEHQVLLAACMYGGFRIVDCKSSSISILAEYNDHGSIAYGADWCYTSQPADDDDVASQFCRMIATCSFYDCKLNVAQIKY